MKIPYFEFYPDDWIGSLKRLKMSYEQQGIYILLLCHTWNDPFCTIPCDIKILQKLCPGAKKKNIEAVVKKCFEPVDNFVNPVDNFVERGVVGQTNPRLYASRQKKLDISQKRSYAAKCLHKNKSGHANAKQMQSKCSANQNQNQNQIKDLTDVIHSQAVHNSDRTSATPAFGEPVADSIRPEKNQPVKPAQKPTRDPKVSTILKSVVQKITTTANPGDGNEAKDDMPKSNPAKPGFNQATIRQPDDPF